MNECKNCRKFRRCEDSKNGKRCTLYIDRNEDRVCWYCGSTYAIEEHHLVHGTANRKHSERLGLVIDLCANCHRNSYRHSAHGNPEFDRKYKQMGQRCFEGRGHAREEFISIFGQSYID